MIFGQRVFIICELSQTHEGSLEIAKLLVKAAGSAGADAVKFQVFAADELAVPSYKHYQLFKQLEWPETSWKDLIQYSHSCGIHIYADVFGVDSLAMLTRNGIDGIKIHGTDMRNQPLLEAASNLDLPILLSVGGGSLEEAEKAIAVLNSKGRKSPIILMHGIQSYPTKIEHTNLRKMLFFGDKIGIPVGFADHIDGDSPLNLALCSTAVGMGAVVIEKHITLSRILRMEDYESALSPDEFVQFVSQLREIEKALGHYSDDLLDIEQEYRKATRKHVVARRTIKKGHVIREDDVILRRAETDEPPHELDEVIGKIADRDYLINEIICNNF